MAINRRNFIADFTAAAVLMGAIPATLPGRGLDSGSEPGEPQGQDGPHDSYEFWSKFFEPPKVTTRGDATRGGGGEGVGSSLAAPERKVQFIHYGPQGLRYVNDIKPDELLDYGGDVMVNVGLGEFHPGAGDRATLKKMKSSQVRVDFVQTKSFMNVVAPLAWTALAVLEHDKAGRLPSLTQLGFQSPNSMTGVQKVLLPGGTAKFAVNVSTVRPESTIHKILRVAAQEASALAPILNLPAISVPALKTFTQVYSLLEAHTNFLLNGLLVQAVATQQAHADPGLEVTHLPLVSGDYVLVPQAHTEELSKELPNLDLQQGYLVRKDASKSEPLETRAENAVQGVSYVSMRMIVTKVEPGGGPSEPNAEEDKGGGADAQPGKGGRPKPGAGHPGGNAGTPPKKKKP
jgi:hypothetical protein